MRDVGTSYSWRGNTKLKEIFLQFQGGFLSCYVYMQITGRDGPERVTQYYIT